MMKRALTIDGPLINELNVQNRKPTTTQPTGGRAKRAFDVTTASLAILTLLPIMAALAFLIWIYDRKSPVFAHTRIGKDGRPFKCLKFRSMAPNSSEILTALLNSDHDARQQWAEGQKLVRDPRVTPIGRILRTSSLDELPQLLNVLKGEMSIVGPRPIVREEAERYGAEFSKYCACRPGLTGLWQVSGRSDCSYAERICYDVNYAETWSLWLDLLIIIKTVPAVVMGKGSY